MYNFAFTGISMSCALMETEIPMLKVMMRRIDNSFFIGQVSAAVILSLALIG